MVKAKEKNSAICNAYNVGYIIRYPVYGTGTVVSVSGNNINKILETEFYSVGIKRLTAKGLKTPCLPRRSNPRQTGLFCVYNHRGLNRQPSTKNHINTKAHSTDTLYQYCTPKLARPEGFEPPISGIGIRCVIQLRHGRKSCDHMSREYYYTLFFWKRQSF